MQKQFRKAGDSMAHKHNVYDTDKHFMIDPITRKITSLSGKTRLMQYDHNSERFTFQMPRYVEGHDMSLCDTIGINYLNLSSDKLYSSEGPYPVLDMQISPDGDDVIIFSWLISGNSTMYVGSLNFAISFECTADGVVDYAWHTDIYDGIRVNEGIKNDGSDVVLEYHDILAQWESNLFGAGDSAIQRIKEAEEAAIEAIRAAGGGNFGDGGGSGGTNFATDGHTLLLENGILRVNTADVVEEDNTLPITSAAVHTTVGNIELLLGRI